MTRAPHFSIEEYLKREGPCLSTRLCKQLEKGGFSPAAARQRISRSHGSVRRLKGLIFPRGARFLYLKSDFSSYRYWEALLREINEGGPAYSSAIAALEVRGGIVPRSHFDIVCGSPLRQRGQISSDRVLDRLINVEIVNLIEIEGIGSSVGLAANGYFELEDFATIKARLITEKILLIAVKDWARKLGFASYNKITIRDDPVAPTVGTFRWDLTGPSYLLPMVRRGEHGKPRPGFLVCDVLAGREINESSIKPFIRKCSLLVSLRRMSPLLPLLIADRFSIEALKLGRSRGIIMATPENLFGKEIAVGLSTLLQTLTKAAAIASKHPNVIVELFEKLGKIEGAASNLRGALFELIVGHCVKKIDGGSIDIGKRLTDPTAGTIAEIDVFRVKEYQEVSIYECKGHQPGEIVNLETINKWTTERVPLIHRNLRTEKRFQECRFSYEFWTCGNFSNDALAFLKSHADKTKKYRIGWKDGTAVRQYVSKVHPKAIADTLNQHYFQHPIAHVDLKYDGTTIMTNFMDNKE